MAVTIRNVRAILTAPHGCCLVVVKVETSEPDLYGLGCATFTQRPLAVRAAVDEYLHPLLAGRPVDRIEDIFRTAMVNAYWRNGPVLNNAISGVDMALWDILGKRAGRPVYDLLGGRCREGVAIYRHASGPTPEACEEKARAFLAEGVRHIRCQLGFYGGGTPKAPPPEGAAEGAYYCPADYARGAVRLFGHMREALGDEVELLHDVHERLSPIDAVRLAKDLEPFRLFFLEDLLAPEDVEYFRHVKNLCATPLAMGELFNNPREWMPLVKEGLIDFIRMHISQIGGLTPARKAAVFAEAMGVRTAWHGPFDVSPVGHACNLHLDLASPNFGIQEWAGVNDTLREVFPGHPEVRGGYLYPNDRPGFGIDLDETLAERFPYDHTRVISWTQARLPDGTMVRP